MIQAAGDAGIRLTLLRVLYQHTGYRGKGTEAGQLRFMDPSLDDAIEDIASLCRNTESDGLVHIGIAPHSVRAVHPNELNALGTWRRTRGLPLHIHAAEQPAEVEEVVEALGKRPIEVLAEAILGDSTTLSTAHTVLRRNGLCWNVPAPGFVYAPPPRPILEMACLSSKPHSIAGFR